MSATTMLPDAVLDDTPKLARKTALHDRPPSQRAWYPTKPR
jgi:hypothetical protein